MGVSTDAILVYGIPLEECAIDHHRDGDPEEGPAWMAASGDEVDGIEIVSHCSDSHPMHIVAIVGTQTRAWRGHPVRVKARTKPRGGAWDRKLRAFVKKHSLEAAPDAKPGWWLCSEWA